MTCNGCATKLERALREETQVSGVEVTVDPGRAVVHGTIARERVREIVESIGFSVL